MWPRKFTSWPFEMVMAMKIFRPSISISRTRRTLRTCESKGDFYEHRSSHSIRKRRLGRGGNQCKDPRPAARGANGFFWSHRRDQLPGPRKSILGVYDWEHRVSGAAARRGQFAGSRCHLLVDAI